MSGSGEYTTTPNLGLFKPTYNADAENWGFHLNSNSDVLDSAMAGGGSYIATGGTVPRTAADRAADVANVLDYGADPTGVADSSAAINAASARLTADGIGFRKTVYLPAGTFKLRQQISLTGGQTLCGDGEGNTQFAISDDFDPAATSVVVCTGVVAVDPGPTIRDIRFAFAQPVDATTRTTFKTLAAGGTSHLGGTGVQYPWAIATSGNCGRVSIQNVQIDASWNGIEANSACYWIDNLRVCAFNIGISMGGTTAAPVADWTHVSDVEFWAFGLHNANLQGIFNDGSTIAWQIGSQNGLTAQNISVFEGQMIFTADAASGWFNFSNLDMDADHATVHVVNAAWLKIVNFYTTCGTGGIRDAVVVENGQVMINSWHSHSGSPHQTLTVNGGDVTVMGASLTRFETTTYAVLTQGNGTLRMIGVKMFAQLPQAYALPLIIQAGGSNLQLDNIDVSGAVGSSGTAVFINTDNVGNSIGRVTLGTGWVNQIQPTFNVGSYGVVASSGGAMTQPLSIAMAPSATTAQLRIAGGGNVNAAESKLWFHGTFPTGGDFFPYLAASIRAGWNVTSWTGGYLNIWLTNATNNPSSDVNMAPIASFTPFGVSLSGDTTFTGTVKGFSMFPVVGSSNSDITHGINLYAGATYGFGVTAARLNYNVGVNSIHAFMVNGADVGLFSASGVTSNFQMQVGGTGGPTWTTGSAAPVANSPVGSLYSRVGGAVGATLYVSRGGGTWAAVAGV